MWPTCRTGIHGPSHKDKGLFGICADKEMEMSLLFVFCGNRWLDSNFIVIFGSPFTFDENHFFQALSNIFFKMISIFWIIGQKVLLPSSVFHRCFGFGLPWVFTPSYSWFGFPKWFTTTLNVSFWENQLEDEPFLKILPSRWLLNALSLSLYQKRISY